MVKLMNYSAASACEFPDVRSHAHIIKEVREAIARLKSGRAAGPDAIPPELLKCATDPISSARHSLFLMVWSDGKFPAA